MAITSRRRFIGAAAAAAVGWESGAFGQAVEEDGKPADLVAVRNGGPAAMFDEGIRAMGGMKRFVRPGQTVVVKPNIAWDKPPEIPANTNPDLVAAIVKHCREAGASKVRVFDHTCHAWEKSYRSSGIAEAAEAAGAEMVAANLEDFYREVEIPGAVTLKKTKVHRELLDCDVLINVPVLKHHGGAQLTMAMKNLMGVVWDRRFYHDNGLDQCIADYCLYPKRPHLNVVDAYRVLRKNGPQGRAPEDGELTKYLILGTDIVAVDAAATKLFGRDLADIRYIGIAGAMGVGNPDLSATPIRRISM